MREVRRKYKAKTQGGEQTILFELPKMPELFRAPEPLVLSKMTEAELSDETEKVMRI